MNFNPRVVGHTPEHTTLRIFANGASCGLLTMRHDEANALIQALRYQTYEALRVLVERCDGAEGVRADGSNIDTTAAHAALGDFEPESA